jgi:streptomycin 6-kinase
MPRYLLDSVGRGGPDHHWLRRLPRTVHQLSEQWSLTLAEPFQPGGKTAWVAPGLDASGREVVLKVAWRHFEAENEADGLRVWNGEGAVRLYGVEEPDERTTALLLERCVPGTALRALEEADQDEVIASLLRRLWLGLPDGHPFRPLESMCQAWADSLERPEFSGRSAVDPGLAREAVAIFRTLAASAERQVLLCTDLHADNVLSAGREPWLVVDPKPYYGDPAYDPVQHMLNCEARLQAGPGRLAQRMASLCGLDSDRVRKWLFARCAQESISRPALADVARRLARGDG